MREKVDSRLSPIALLLEVIVPPYTVHSQSYQDKVCAVKGVTLRCGMRDISKHAASFCAVAPSGTPVACFIWHQGDFYKRKVVI